MDSTIARTPASIARERSSGRQCGRWARTSRLLATSRSTAGVGIVRARGQFATRAPSTASVNERERVSDVMSASNGRTIGASERAALLGTDANTQDRATDDGDEEAWERSLVEAPRRSFGARAAVVTVATLACGAFAAIASTHATGGEVSLFASALGSTRGERVAARRARLVKTSGDGDESADVADLGLADAPKTYIIADTEPSDDRDKRVVKTRATATNSSRRRRLERTPSRGWTATTARRTYIKKIAVARNHHLERMTGRRVWTLKLTTLRGSLTVWGFQSVHHRRHGTEQGQEHMIWQRLHRELIHEEVQISAGWAQRTHGGDMTTLEFVQAVYPTRWPKTLNAARDAVAGMMDGDDRRFPGITTSRTMSKRRSRG